MRSEVFFSEIADRDLVLRREDPDEPLPPEDRVMRVRIATFRSFGLEDMILWRFIRRTAGEAFDHVRLTFRCRDSYGQRISRDFGEFGTPDYVEVDHDADFVSEQRTVRAMRWVMPLLGLAEPFAGPLPKTAPVSIQNPYIGRFRGRTVEEVLESATDLDRKDRKFGLPLNITLGSELFEGETRLARKKTATGLFQWGLLGPRYGEVIDSSFSENPSIFSFVSRTIGAHHPTFVVLPSDLLELWWKENSTTGDLSVPLEEVELYRALGEKVPYLWPASEVSRWAVERWSS